jgi:hypothetical protein
MKKWWMPLIFVRLEERTLRASSPPSGHVFDRGPVASSHHEPA